MLAAFRGLLASLWTAIPGIVQSFDAEAGTVTVQPAVRGVQQAPDGSVAAVQYPLLVDVPVCFPRGGGATMTFPIGAGDEALVVFSCRAIDAWWQSGGVQAPNEPRMHDMADGFAIVGPLSQAKMIGSVSTDSVQLRSDDGDSYIELVPGTGVVNIVAPGGFNVIAPTWNTDAAGGGDTEIAMKGNFNFTGTMKSNGKVIDNTHTHGGVQTGSGSTGQVN